MLGVSIKSITKKRQDNKRNEKLVRYYKAMASEDYEGALWHIEKYLEQHPKDHTAMAFKGKLFIDTGRKKEGVAILNRLRNKSKEPGEIYYLLALHYHYNEEDYAYAVSCYLNAINHSKKDANVYTDLGKAYLKKGDVQNAKKALTRALNMQSGNKEETYAALWDLHRQLGDVDKMNRYKMMLSDPQKYSVL